VTEKQAYACDICRTGFGNGRPLKPQDVLAIEIDGKLLPDFHVCQNCIPLYIRAVESVGHEISAAVMARR
jgi:hypothetical protein